MDIGYRLQELRDAKGMSQGDIEKRTGLYRCYVSRVECGHAMPQLDTLKKWAKALGLTLGEFFAGLETTREPAELRGLTHYEKRLFVCLRRMEEIDQRLFLSIARTLVKQRGRHGRSK